MDVVWSVLQVLGQHCEVRTIVLPCPKDGSLSPVGPEDVLFEDGQGVRVLDPLHDHLSVLPSQSGPLNFVSVAKGSKGALSNIMSSIGSAATVNVKKTGLTMRNQPSRASSPRNPETGHWAWTGWC